MSPIVSHCDLEQGIKYWHLVKPEDETIGQPKDMHYKAIPEIFLTRLLSTKVRGTSAKQAAIQKPEQGRKCLGSLEVLKDARCPGKTFILHKHLQSPKPVPETFLSCFTIFKSRILASKFLHLDPR